MRSNILQLAIRRTAPALLLSLLPAAAYAIPGISLDTVAGDDAIGVWEEDADVVITGTTTNVESGQGVTVSTYASSDAGVWRAANTYNGTGTLSTEIHSGQLIYKPTWTSTTEQFTTCAPIDTIDMNGSDYFAEVWMPSAYVADGNLGFQPYILDSAGRYASLLWQNSGSLIPDSWNTVSLTAIAPRKLNYKAANFDLTSIVCLGFQLDANGKAVEATGDILFDNVSIVNPTAGTPIDFTFTSAHAYFGTVASDGTWSVTMPAADAQALPSVTLLTANVADLASTEAPQAQKGVSHPIAIAFDAIAGDNAVNLVEDDADVTISGATARMALGQSITITTYDALSSGIWGDVYVDSGSGTATHEIKSGQYVYKPDWADTTDKFGIASPIEQIDISGATYSVDVWVPSAYVNESNLGIQPYILDSASRYAAIVWASAGTLIGDSWNTLSLTGISVSNLDYVEAGFDLASVTGIGLQLNANTKPVGVTGDLLFDNLSITNLTAGTPISLTFTSTSTYTGTVTGDGTWSATMPAADAQALPSTTLVTADGVNVAGEHAVQAKTSLGHTIAAPTIAIDTVAGDDHIDGTEDDSPINLTGTTSGVEDEQAVTLTLNGSTYSGSISSNTWSITISSAALEALSSNETVTADVSNAAGDTAVKASKAITATNDNPVVTLPSTPTVIEDDINVVIADDISIADVEGDSQTITLTITGGTVSISTAGLTFSTGDGTDDAAMAFSGTLAAINTALDAMTFTPTANLNGTNAGGIQIDSSDGNGGSDSKTLQFDINAVNDVPVVTLPSAPTVAEDDSNVAIADDVNIADVDGDAQTVALTITGGTVSISTAGLTFSTGDGTDDAALAFSGTLSAINTALDAMTFTPTANLNGTNAGGIQIDSNDGNGGSDSKTLQFNITSVNDVPVVTLPSAPTVAEDDSNVAIADDVHIADVDGNAQTVALTITGGTVSVSTAGLTFSTGDGIDDTAMAFSGTLAAINTALDAMTFTPKANLHGSNAGGIQIDSSDGNGGSDSKTLQFNITSVNDVPVVTLPSAPTVAEDDSNVAIADDVNIADVDGDAQTVTLTITGGTVSVGTAGLTFSTGDGIDDANMTFSGTLAAINTALDAMTFTPSANLHGSNAGGIQIDSSDGNGGSASKTLQFDISSVNDAPLISGTPATTVSEDNAYSFTPTASDVDTGDSLTFSIANKPSWLVFSTSTGTLSGTPKNSDVGTFSNIIISVSDSVETASLPAFAITVSNTNDAPIVTLPTMPTVVENSTAVALADNVNIRDDDGDDQTVTLTATGGSLSLITTGLTFTSGDGSDDGYMVFSANLADINAALDSMTFTPTPNLSGSDVGGLQIDSSDGNGGGDSQSFTFDITAAGTPSITLPQTPEVYEDDVLVAIDDTLHISDSDADAQTVSLSVTGGTVSLDTTGLVFSLGDGLDDSAMTFSGSLAAVNAALDSLTFNAQQNLNGTGVAIIEIQSSDDDGTTAATFNFDIIAVNDAPFITLPAAPVVIEDDFDVALDDALSISDVDDEPQTVVLTATGGTLTLATTGISLQSGDGTNDSTMSFNGSLANVNAALATLTFTPAANLNGTLAGAIRIETSDSSNASDSDTLRFDIVSVNDAPVIILPPPPNVIEDDLHVPMGAELAIADVDIDAQTVTLTVTGGVLTIDGAGLNFTTGTGIDDALMVFRGSLADINNALAGATFTPTTDLNGTDAGGLRIHTTDGYHGSDEQQLTFDIIAVNDAPTIAGTPSTSVAPNAPYQFVPSATDIDSVDLSFSIINRPGWATFNSSTGTLSGTPGNADIGTTSDIVISVSDGAVSVSLPSFSLIVSEASNNAPLASEQTVEVVENLSQTVVLSGSDADGDALSYSFATTPTKGSLSGSAPNLVYTPAAGYVGSDSFTFTVSDHTDTSPPATLHLTVLGDLDADGVADLYDDDDDGDGIPDAVEGTEDSDGDGIIDSRDLDSDNDGRPDSEEGTMDSDGDGISDYIDNSLDEDGDGIPDIIEGTLDSDGDGIPNFLDHDSDNDGIFDGTEALVSFDDDDNDGIVNMFDVDFTGGIDINGDGIDDQVRPVDTDGDGIADHLDRDSDNDGLPDALEGETDADADGTPNYRDLDSDNDGLLDTLEGGMVDEDHNGIADDGQRLAKLLPDTDNDGVPDMFDLDSNNDGEPDIYQTAAVLLDHNGDNRIDSISDLDGDGLDDLFDLDLAHRGTLRDSDLDGIPDHIDIDDDNDGIPDRMEGEGDADGDGIPNRLDRDSDGDGISDRFESGLGSPLNRDVDNDGLDDAFDSDQNGGTDADIDGIDDRFDADFTGGPDLNDDGIDDTQVGLETFVDSDGDGIPDRYDVDSDNDGLSDAMENLLMPLLGQDLDRDGIDDGIDVDFTRGEDVNSDGIDDAALDPTDLDGDGLLAYRDVDSDGDGYTDLQEDGDFNADGVNDRSQPQTRMRTANRSGGSVGIGSLLLLLIIASLTRTRSGIRGTGRALAACLLTPFILMHQASAAPSPPKGLYGGVGAGISHLQPDENGSGWQVTDNQAAAYKVFLGYQITSRLFTELDYTDLGGAGIAPLNPALGDAQSITYEALSLSAGYYLLNPSRRGNLFLRLGVASLNNDQTGQAEIYHQMTSTQPVVGLGAQWRGTENIFVRFEAARFAGDAHSFSLSLGYLLGKNRHTRSAGKRARPATAEQQVAKRQPAGSTTLCSPISDLMQLSAQQDRSLSRYPESSDDRGRCRFKFTEPVEVGLSTLFQSNSAEMHANDYSEIERLADFMHTYPESTVLIEAHTEEVGDAEANDLLSQRRALAVAGVLRDYMMIEGSRITAIGYGESRPKVRASARDAHTHTHTHTQNRRIIVKIYPR